jgi:uncharacterized membrane protein
MNRMFEPHTRVTRIAYGAVFAALVAAATSVLNISIPSTKGYFNLGDMMVYTAAILTGPLVGGLAGGVGSALSDAYLGYFNFAPGTLVIKGLEGLIVGYLFRRRDSHLVEKHWKAVTLVMSGVLFLLIASMDSFYFSGGVNLETDFLGMMMGGYSFSAYFDTLLVGGAVAATLVACWGFRSEPKLGWASLSIVLGGAEMIAGYFTYEVSLLGVPVPGALVEVPVNGAQLVFGLVGALFLTEGVAAVFKRPSARTPRPTPP